MENTGNIEKKGEENRTYLTDDEKTIEHQNSEHQTKNKHTDKDVNSLENEDANSLKNVSNNDKVMKSNERGIDVEMFVNGDEGRMRGGGKKIEGGKKDGECNKTIDVNIEEGEENKMCGKKTPLWLKRVRKDLAQKQFIPIKVLYFLLFGAMMCLFPFLTLQARSLGITEKEMSLLFALSPIIAFVGPPLTGILADRIGNFKVLLSVLMGSSGAVALGYLLVPDARRVVPMPSQLPYTITTTIITTNSTGSHDVSPLSSNTNISLDSPFLCEYSDVVDKFTAILANCTACDGIASLLTFSDDDAVEVTVMRENNNQTKATTTTLLVTALPHTLITDSQAIDTLVLGDECVVTCSSVVNNDDLCTNTNVTQEFNPSATFFSYMAIRLLNGLALATSHTMFQGATMAILRQYKGDLGLQRLYANLGAIVMTPISGVLIDVFSGMSGRQDFRPAFFLYFTLKLMGALVILVMDLDFRMPSDRVTKDFKALLKNAEVITFLVVMLITGAFFGLLDTFLFWLLQDLGAKKSLMGITVTVGTIAGIPILVASGHIINTLGHANTIIIGLAFYVIRMIGYSYLTSPWWCLPFEVLECFTVSLLGTASASYADDLATPATIATLQGMTGGIHHGVGRALGSFIGGFLIAPLGIPVTFRIAAGVSAVTCVIYFVANRFFFRNQQEERRKAKARRMLEDTRGEDDTDDTKKNITKTLASDAEKNRNEDENKRYENNENNERNVARKADESAGKEGKIEIENDLDVAKVPNTKSNALQNSLDVSHKKIPGVEENDEKDKKNESGIGKYENPAFEKD